MRFLVLLAILFLASCEHKSDEEKIKECFRTYFDAARNNDGESAVKLISSASIKYYDYLLHFIQSADSIEIDELTYIDKVTLLTARHTIDKQTIINIPDGQALFSILIDSGMVSLDTGEFQMLKVEVNEKHATAVMRKDNSNIVLDIEFKNENGIWLFDLTSILKNYGSDIEKYREDDVSYENTLLLNLLESEYNKKPADDIWEPLVEQ